MELCASLHFHRSPRCGSVGFRPTAHFVLLHIPSRTRCWCVEKFSLQERFYLLPVQLDVRPQVDRFVFADVHRTVFAQEHAVYIGIEVEGWQRV